MERKSKSRSKSGTPNKKKKNSHNFSFNDDFKRKSVLNPFMLFCQEQNSILKKEGKLCSLKQFGMKWDILSMDQKEIYIKKYEENKKENEIELEGEKKLKKSLENKKKPSINNNSKKSLSKKSLDKERKSTNSEKNKKN